MHLHWVSDECAINICFISVYFSFKNWTTNSSIATFAYAPGANYGLRPTIHIFDYSHLEKADFFVKFSLFWLYEYTITINSLVPLLNNNNCMFKRFQLDVYQKCSFYIGTTACVASTTATLLIIHIVLFFDG